MTVRMQTRRILYLAAMAGMTMVLVGCDSFRDAAGLTKEAPDEFAVVTKAPLVMPPDYNLRPPRPGAAPTNQISPSETAQEALYGQAPVTATAKGPLSPAEQQLLAKSGAATADSLIRQKIAADDRAMQASDESFTNQLLFGAGSDSSKGTPVDADAEAQRLGAGKSGTATPSRDANPEENSTTIEKDSGGWLDGIFDGVF